MPQGRRRLIICGVCLQPDCPWSRWVDDDGGELVDELHQLWIDCQHSEMEEANANKRTREETQQAITEAIAQIREETGEIPEIENLDELLNRAIQTNESKTTYEKDSLLDDILRKNSVELERDNPPDEKTKGH